MRVGVWGRTWPRRRRAPRPPGASPGSPARRGRWGLPISSSPSTRNFRLTGASSAARTWAKSCPLSSEAPGRRSGPPAPPGRRAGSPKAPGDPGAGRRSGRRPERWGPSRPRTARRRGWGEGGLVELGAEAPGLKPLRKPKGRPAHVLPPGRVGGDGGDGEKGKKLGEVHEDTLNARTAFPQPGSAEGALSPRPRPPPSPRGGA